MAHFIVRSHDKDTPMYQYRRRGNYYKKRTVWGSDIGQACVFTTRTAAVLSSEGYGKVVEVELVEKKS